MKKIFASVLLAGLLLSLAACGGDGSAVYVQSVRDLTGFGGIAPGDRFGGVVVSENVAKIEKDADKTVKELLVTEGQDVTAGQPLFSYDTDQLQLELDKKKLELEQLRASIDNFKAQIKELEAEKAKAPAGDKLQYTVQIQTAQLDLKEAELNLKNKETEVSTAETLLENATVVSPVDGRVQSITENGMDNYGNPLPYISIQQAGAYRVKGILGELQRGGIMEGTRLKIVSRTDETRFWTGTVSLIDYENPSQGNSMGGMIMYETSAADGESTTNASKYPFYVTLDSTEGLILGQHVYMELESTSQGTALSISAAFVAYDDNGEPFVWADKRGKLEKRRVELGEYDPMNDTVPVLSGLSEDDYIAFPDDSLCHEGATTTRTAAQPEGEEVA